MDYLLDLFSDRKEQVQFVAIVFSVIIAIAVVLLNHFFTWKREAKKTKIEKIEDLYVAAMNYRSNCYQILNATSKHFREHPNKPFSPPMELVNNIADSITKIEMMCGLHFPSEQIDFERFNLFKFPLFDDATNEVNDCQERTANIIKENYDYLFGICKTLMSQTNKIWR